MRKSLIAMIAGMAVHVSAGAQAPLLFPAESYGQANKAFAESSQNQAVLEVLMGKQDVFEPVADMFEGDSFRQLGRSVGMLDLLVERGERRANSTCTATLIAADRAITNHHCIPGAEWRTVSAQLRLGFLDRANAPGDLFAVTTTPVESSAALDYAIFEVRGVPAAKYPPARIAPRAVAARESLYLVHHPAGQPQKLTRIRCQAGTPAVNADKRLVHHCDTLGGSSGTAIFAMTDGAFAGLHHSGVPDNVRPYNLGTPSADLIAASAELRRIVGGGGVAAAPGPAESGMTAARSAAAAFAAATSNRPTAERTFRDCADCPEMVALPAGAFWMGSPDGEGADNERPTRRVTIGYQIAVGRTEVTSDQWGACMADGGCPPLRADGFGGGLRPVTHVGWTEAKGYAAWLSRETGQTYRLPSEAEWEYAARARTTGPYSTGASLTNQQANFLGGPGKTTPVGQFPANPFGLHDMHGNVWEWTEDCAADAYSAGHLSDGSAYESRACPGRVVRGGSWQSSRNLLRSAYRSFPEPGGRFETQGFRVVREME